MKVYLENEVLGNPTMFIPHFNGSYKIISPEIPKNYDKDILVKIPIFPDNAEVYEFYFRAGIKSQGKQEIPPISPHFKHSMKTCKIRKTDVRGKNRTSLKQLAHEIQKLNLVEFSTTLIDHLKQEEYPKFCDYRNQLTELLEKYGHLYDTLMKDSEPITPREKKYAFES